MDDSTATAVDYGTLNKFESSNQLPGELEENEINGSESDQLINEQHNHINEIVGNESPNAATSQDHDSVRNSKTAAEIEANNQADGDRADFNPSGSPVRLEVAKDPKYATIRMKDYMRRAVKATSQYNKMINQERKDERRICLDLQTYTLHYPLGLGAENRMLKRNVENGRCSEKGKYPIAVLPGHYQDQYRKYTSQELKYFPINTVIYGPVITDTDKLPPILTRIEEDSFSESDSDSSTSTEHSCCCDEKSCKKLKLENGCGVGRECDCLREVESVSSSAPPSESELEEDDEQPPKLINLSVHFQHREHAFCDLCKKKDLTKVDGTNERLIHCTDCNLSYHPVCLEMTPEMISEVQLYPWQCSNCKSCNVSFCLAGLTPGKVTNAPLALTGMQRQLLREQHAHL